MDCLEGQTIALLGAKNEHADVVVDVDDIEVHDVFYSAPINVIDKLGLSWAKLSCKMGFDCTVINICCLILINLK